METLHFQIVTCFICDTCLCTESAAFRHLLHSFSELNEYISVPHWLVEDPTIWFQQYNSCVDNLPWKIGRGQASNYGFAPCSQRLSSDNSSHNWALWKPDESRTTNPYYLTVFLRKFFFFFTLPSIKFLLNVQLAVVWGMITSSVVLWHVDRYQLMWSLFRVMTSKHLLTSACYLMFWAPSHHVFVSGRWGNVLQVVFHPSCSFGL